MTIAVDLGRKATKQKQKKTVTVTIDWQDSKGVLIIHFRGKQTAKLPSMQRVTLIWASTRENLREFANNKGTDQPAHLRSLISALVIRFLESTISKLATSNFLASPCS